MKLGPSGHVPGFCVPKGLDPLMPLFLDALRLSTQTREHALEGINMLLMRTAADTAKSYTSKITGALIRVTNEASSSGRELVVRIFTTMLYNFPDSLKTFAAQLQVSARAWWSYFDRLLLFTVSFLCVMMCFCVYFCTF